MSLVKAALNYILNSGDRTTQDAPYGVTQKANAALMGLLSNDVSIDARLAAAESAVAGVPVIGSLVPAAPEGITSAGATPWSAAAQIAAVVSPNYAVSPTSANGNPGAFVTYVPIVGTVIFNGRPTKLYVAVYSSQYYGTNCQIVAVSNNGAIAQSNVFNVLGNDFINTNSISFFCWEQVGQWQVYARSNGSSDTLCTINPTTLAVTTLASATRTAPGFVSRLATRAFPCGVSSSVAVGLVGFSTSSGFSTLVTMPRGLSTEYLTQPVDLNDAQVHFGSGTMANVGSPPVLESMGNGLFALFSVGVPSTGGQSGELTVLRADDTGIRVLARILTPFAVSYATLRVIGSTIYVTGNGNISSTTRRWGVAYAFTGDGVATAYALSQVAPSSGYFTLASGLATNSPNPTLNHLGVLLNKSTDLVFVTCEGTTTVGAVTNTIGFHRATFDPVAGTATEAAGFTTTVGTAYDGGGFQPGPAVQPWPDIALVGGWCGQGGTYYGAAVHTTYQLS